MSKPFRDNRFLQALMVWLGLLWLITAIEPFDRRDWLLENLLAFAGAVLAMLIAWQVQRRRRVQGAPGAFRYGRRPPAP